MDDEADHRPDRERERRPHIERLHGQADKGCPGQRTDDGADPPDAQLPSRTIGTQRRRIDHRSHDVEARLDAQHQEAGEECRGQQRGLRGQPRKPDRADHRHRENEHDCDGEEAMPLQPPAQGQRADGSAHLKQGAGERPGRRRQLGRRQQRWRPAQKKEKTHQIERKQQPQQRRDQRQSFAEQIDRIETRKLLLVFDHETCIRGYLEIRTDRGNERFHFAALALVQRHVFDRLRQAE